MTARRGCAGGASAGATKPRRTLGFDRSAPRSVLGDGRGTRDDATAQDPVALVKHAGLSGRRQRRFVQRDDRHATCDLHSRRPWFLARPQLHRAAQVRRGVGTNQFTSRSLTVRMPVPRGPTTTRRRPVRWRPRPAAALQHRGIAQPLTLPHRVARDPVMTADARGPRR